MKRKNSSRPSKLKRMRSLKVSGAGSTAEEPAGIPQCQPTPGPSGVRNDFRGEDAGPPQEDGFEEVGILQEDDKVSLEDEEKKDEGKKEIKKRRRCAALGFSQSIVERPPTYDKLIEGILWVAFPEELEMELEIPWEERFF